MSIDVVTEALPHPMAKVEIAAGGRSVLVEAAEPLDRVRAVALQLWDATDVDPSPGLSIMGFQGDLAADDFLLLPDDDGPQL